MDETVRSQLQSLAASGEAKAFWKRYREATAETPPERVDLLSLEVPGDPVAKGRPRMTRAGRTYTPAKTAAWTKRASELFVEAYQGEVGLNCCLGLEVEAVQKRPKRLLRKKDPEGRIRRRTKPDGDNVLKIVADALTKSGIIEDDRFIVEWVCRDFYAAKGEGPKVVVRLYELDELV